MPRRSQSRWIVATFAGTAPASNPRLVVVVSINDPASEQYYGGQIAAPTFRAVMSSALRLLDIPPDNLLPDPEPLLAGGSR